MPTFPVIDYVPVPYEQPDQRNTQTVILVGRANRQRYEERWSKDDYDYKPSQLSARLANFYQNLIGLARALRSNRIPVRFENLQGDRWHLDLGCIKMAEHAGFIQQLENGRDGELHEIVLAWRTDGTSVLNGSSD